MSKPARLGVASLAVFASLMSSALVSAQDQSELEAYEDELIEYETQLDERAAELDERELELDEREAALPGGGEEIADQDAAESDTEEQQAESDSVQVSYGEGYAPTRSAPGGATTTYDAESLRASGINGLADMVAGNAAGLLIQPSDFNSSTLNLTLRGISSSTSEPGVGVFIDGAYISRAEGLAVDVLDLESIEVQRGSQAILSGRNTLGGAVHMVTSKPTGELGVEQKLLFGSEYDEVQSVTHLNLPRFADLLSVKLSYLVHNHDGWVFNAPASGTEVNNFWSRDNEAFRAAIRLDQGGPFTYDYSYMDAELDSTAPYFQTVATEPARQETARSSLELPQSTTEIRQHNQTVTLRGEKARLTSITSFREVNAREFTNFDGVFGPEVLPVISTGDRLEQDQFSQEVRLDTTLFEGFVDLTVGFQNFREDIKFVQVGSGNSGDQINESFSVFAQAIFALADQLDLTLGWRDTSDEKEFDVIQVDGAVSGVELEDSDRNSDYKIALAYDINETLSTYVSFATGYKSFTLVADESFVPFVAGNTLAAETSETIELGVTGSAWDNRIDYSAAVYSTDIDDRQVVLPTPGDVRFFVAANDTASTTIEGFELDLSIRPIEKLKLSAFYSYMDIDSNQLAGLNSLAGVSETFVPRAPEHSGSFALDYDFGDFELGAVTLHLEYHNVGEYHFTTTNPRQDARGEGILNARLDVKGFELEDTAGTINMGIWMDNALDEDYKVAGQLIDNGGQGVTSAYGEPRTYGIDILYSF